MSATPARIGFITQSLRRAITETTLAKDQFGSLARQSEDPVETFFDSVDDAQVMADERQELLSAVRRRFSIDVAGVEEISALTYSAGALPIVRYTDDERRIERDMLVGEIVIDLAKQRSALNIWG